MEISLKSMTNEICRQFYREFVLDSALFANPAEYKPYVYNEESCDAYFARYQAMGRVHMAVMQENRPIGEIVLKNIDYVQKCCTMGITMVNDDYKNKGYGTQAEKLALRYAFDEMQMDTVYADALLGNERSQQVLLKVGFAETHRSDMFVYYRCDKIRWQGSSQEDR